MATALRPGEGFVGDTEPGGSSVRLQRQGIHRHPVQIVPEDYASFLVVAPHPDDETIGAGGLIRAMTALGRRVRVVVVSDGAASHPNSRTYPPHKLAALRQTESISALETLGVARKDIRFCGFSDGQSAGWKSDARALSRLTEAVSGHYDLVCLPAEHDNHADHRKTRELVRPLLQSRVQQLNYLVWPAEPELKAKLPARPKQWAEYRLPDDFHAAKIAAMQCYQSQLGLITDDPAGFTIDAETFARFTASVERFSL